jgi:hypothetical protein
MKTFITIIILLLIPKLGFNQNLNDFQETLFNILDDYKNALNESRDYNDFEHQVSELQFDIKKLLKDLNDYTYLPSSNNAEARALFEVCEDFESFSSPIVTGTNCLTAFNHFLTYFNAKNTVCKEQNDVFICFTNMGKFDFCYVYSKYNENLHVTIEFNDKKKATRLASGKIYYPQSMTQFYLWGNVRIIQIEDANNRLMIKKVVVKKQLPNDPFSRKVTTTCSDEFPRNL